MMALCYAAFPQARPEIAVAPLFERMEREDLLNFAVRYQITFSNPNLDTEALRALVIRELETQPALQPVKLNLEEFIKIKPIQTLQAQELACLFDLITRVRSISSKCMSKLMDARKTENDACWLRKIWHIAKVAVCELALPILTVVATIESAVYYLLHNAAKAIKPISSRPLEMLEKWNIQQRKESARFTIWWTISMLYHNISMQPRPVDEDAARDFLKYKFA